VRVNAVAPGGTPSGLAGLKTMGTETTTLQDIRGIDDIIRASNPLHVVTRPADHAPAFLFLARRENVTAITGNVIVSDGGMAIRGTTQPAGLDA
jgi:NAD(P)-dependent dehydrogenase (short-subunit alcohol dehydrogenase family)